MTRNYKKTFLEFLQVVAGSAICAFAMACFALPYNMVVAGVSGIGRVLDFYFGISVSATVAVANVALFLLGAIMLGKKFAASIAVGTFAFPFFLSLFQNLEMLHHLVDDPLLAAICAGVLDGAGLGLVIRIGGSTGGMDVPAIILNRKFGWKTATVISATDILIFLVQLPMTKPNGIILGILYALIYSVVMNHMILLEQGGMQMMIWSEKTREINERLLELGYGTTLFKATGGYMRDDKEVILCATGTRTMNRAKRAVLELDDKAFITITTISEVNGNGFTLMFPDEEYTEEIAERHDGLSIRDKQDKH